MFNRIRTFLSPPSFEDEEKQRVAGVLHPILLILIVGMTLGLPALLVSTTAENNLPVILLIVPLIAVNFGAYILLRKGRVRLAAIIAVLVIGLAIFGAYAGSSFESVGAGISFILLIALVVLLLDARAVAWLTGAIVLFTLVMAIAQANNWVQPVFTTYTDPIGQWISTAFVYLLSGVMFVLATRSLHRAVQNVRTSERELKTVNRDLVELSATLEERVNLRTAELESANALSQKRASQFETIARISAEITATRDLQELLPRVAEAISRQFGFYHVGIFFNDEAGQFTILRAANSAGGQKMLARNHQLRIGQQGIVGYVTGAGLPRVVQNVGEDSIYFNNPDLPETRSEIALPLKIGGKTIGALDVQSVEISAITNEDIASLSILADQVSIAIENARLYESVQKSLEQTRAAYSQYVQAEWTQFARDEKITGYEFKSGSSRPLTAPAQLRDEFQEAREGRIAQTGPEKNGVPARLAAPVKLRDKVIGVLHISQPERAQWTEDDIDIAEAAMERLAVSLENARLFDIAASRAARERIISEISSRISGNIRVGNILQMAAQELSQAFNGSEVLIQLQTPKRSAEDEE
ncbi:MAG TPA: GAF domain-containing protein [Anaerolineales bacterium]|nr:GAF domain-containing protein [Anaerolineales bacterium]